MTIHGRTRECKFEGEVDYGAIREIKSAVSIPVVANGDIDTPEKASEVISITGADAVMIGRAAQGRPWVADTFDHYLKTGEKKDNPGEVELKRILLRHLVELHRFYGEMTGVRIARKHIGWYLREMAGRDDFRQHFNKLQTSREQLEAIERATRVTTANLAA